MSGQKKYCVIEECAYFCGTNDDIQMFQYGKLLYVHYFSSFDKIGIILGFQNLRIWHASGKEQLD